MLFSTFGVHRDRSSRTEGPATSQLLINTNKIMGHTVHILKILREWFQTFLVEVGVALRKVATEFCCSFVKAEDGMLVMMWGGDSQIFT